MVWSIRITSILTTRPRAAVSAADLRDAKSALEGPKLPRKVEQADAASAVPVYVYPWQIEASLVALAARGLPD